MNYRKLGNTDLLVSEISLGCEGLCSMSEGEICDFIDYAEHEGINCIDLYTPNPKVRKALSKAIFGKRDKFILQSHICTIWENDQYSRIREINKVKSSFKTMLEELATDYIDIGMIHYVDSIEDLNNILNGEISTFVKDLKNKGIIKYIGMSSHNPDTAIKAINEGLIDVLMFSVNPCYDLLPANEDVEELWNPKNYEKNLLNMEPKRKELYELCLKKGIGITVMKAFGGGDLLNKELSPAKMSLTPVQCIHYALTRPGVACVMSGARNIEELKQSLYYEYATDDEKDYAIALSEFPKMNWEGHCMYCTHCAPCPKGIDVALITKFLNIVNAQNFIPETIQNHYDNLKHKAKECIQCSLCMKRCPFKVNVIENMMKAKALFDK